MKGTGILQALLTLDAVAVGGLAAAAWAASHPAPPPAEPLARHVAWGLAATGVNLAARCVAIFYMLASGRAVKDVVAERNLDPAFVARAKRLARGVETLATLALVPVMGAAMGGALARPGEAGAHAAWAWTSVGVAVACLAFDARTAVANHRLLREVDGAVPGPGAAGDAA